ncbi:hypothetical protein GCWU000321_01411 [Dialister invisus DSM 15470]|uniref:Uncharacterized protein n=1 Tax=Dialister invisus DSM 15470 TaxID=592028 RepID=C9LPD3_9FIRM|nr:hypothetical protein GCWU000321_01411 [Dialister invisus DSM 15470]
MDEETGVEHVAAFLHIFADRISFGFKDMGIGIQAGADFVAQGVAVVLLDGIPPCYAGKDKFASAAEACYVMGGKSVQENDFVRFRDAFIQPYFRAAGGHAHMGEHVFIPAVMLVHGNASRHFFSHTFDIFRFAVRPVGTLGENDENVFIRNSCEVQFIDHMDGEIAGMVPRAGDVGDDKADLVALLYFFGKRRGADGAAHTFDSRFFNIAGSCRYTFQYVGYMLFREHDRLEPAAERKFVFF